MTVKLPVSVEGTLILDADGEVVASVRLPSAMATAEARDEAYSRANALAAALNRSVPPLHHGSQDAPDLTALREAVEAYRLTSPFGSGGKVAARSILIAALALFPPKDGDADA